MKDTQQVQDEMKKEDVNKKSTDGKTLALGFLNLNISVLTIAVLLKSVAYNK